MKECLIPALDDTILTDIEDEGLVSFKARIEFFSIQELSRVVYTDTISFLWLSCSKLILITCIDFYFKIAILVDYVFSILSENYLLANR